MSEGNELEARVISIPIGLIAPWRCSADRDWRDYRQAMREERLPPVHVMRQSTAEYGYPYRLLDGFHRTRAAKSIGLKTVKAIVIVDDR